MAKYSSRVDQDDEKYYLIIKEDDTYWRKDEIKILMESKEKALEILGVIQKHFDTDFGRFSKEDLERIRLDLYRQKYSEDLRVLAINQYVASCKTKITWFDAWVKLYGDYSVKDKVPHKTKSQEELYINLIKGLMQSKKI